MRCAQIDSFPQNPAEPIPAGRASPCWHIVAWFGTTAYPLSLSYDRCLALPCLARPCRAPPSPAMDASASFPPTSCAGGGIRKLLSRVLLRACLGTHVAAQSPFRAFARPAVPSRPVFTSPVSRASFELSGRPLAPPTVSKPALMEGSRGSTGFFNSESVVVCGCWLMGYRLHLQVLKMGQYFSPHPLERGLP